MGGGLDWATGDRERGRKDSRMDDREILRRRWRNQKPKKNQELGAISAADFTDSITDGFAYGSPHLGGEQQQGKSNRLASRVQGMIEKIESNQVKGIFFRCNFRCGGHLEV